MRDTHPPTHEESLAYIEAKKLDVKTSEVLAACERIAEMLEASNRRYERKYRRPDPLPRRRGGALALWLLLWALVAFFSGSLYAASSGAQVGRQGVCVDRLSALADSSVMSRTTARRKATKICRGLETMAPSFFRAITR